LIGFSAESYVAEFAIVSRPVFEARATPHLFEAR